jgi:hypothetical protein
LNSRGDQTKKKSYTNVQATHFLIYLQCSYRTEQVCAMLGSLSKYPFLNNVCQFKALHRQLGRGSGVTNALPLGEILTAFETAAISAGVPTDWAE